MSHHNKKKILVLGAGLVSKPLVKYLMEPENFEVTVASRTVSKADALVEGHPRGISKQLDIDNAQALEEEVKKCDLAVSLLPAYRHLEVAKLCLKHGKHFFTTSYVKPEMRALDSQVREKDLIFMNELGVDPGIDHMSAMKIFDDVRAKGGKITSFMSYCGGLPAPEANDNPWGYKFSWSPESVLLAGKNSFKIQRDGKIIEKPSAELFKENHLLDVPTLGKYTAYPNRDSIQYKDLYNLKDVKTIGRWTLRNKGWCDVMQHMHKTSLLDDKEMKGIKGKTYAQFLSMCIGKGSEATIKKDLAVHLGINENHELIKWFDWLGLFGKEKIMLDGTSAIKVMADLMMKKMAYKDGERDMIILHHEFLAEYPKAKEKEKITSTLIDFGIPHGDSSMSRTVGLPCAIAVKLFLQGKYKTKGVLIPVDRDVYMPILEELENQNIKFVERVHKT